MYQPIMLPYDFGSLEPHISRKTLENHYQNHYLKYLNKLNTILKNNDFTFDYPVYQLFDNISLFPIHLRSDIIYNAGGVVNHELYFSSIRPNGNLYMPDLLRNKIIATFGSIDSFIEQFTALANNLPGSGYTFLVLNSKRELYLINLPNQESPISLGMVPLFGIDVWEHAYYLDYGSNRELYIKNFLKVADFTQANEKYLKTFQN